MQRKTKYIKIKKSFKRVLKIVSRLTDTGK